MNIVVASDNNFVQHCAVTLLSLLKHNRDVCIFLLTEGLTEDNEQELTHLVESEGGRLHLCKVPGDIVQHFPMSKLASGHISIATYYRLFVTRLLPETLDKVIYLDCDMVVRGSLEELWNTDLQDKALAAVYQPHWWADHNLAWERLYIPREFGYFNAGMLVMNLKFLREFGFQDKAIRYINDNFDRIISHDQDVLNSLLHKFAVGVSPRWNYLSGLLSGRTDSNISPVIVHFVSVPKPWQYGCRNPYTHEYYEILRETKWADFKPRFVWRQYWSFVIIPTLKAWLKPLDVFGFAERRHRNLVRKQYSRQ